LSQKYWPVKYFRCKALKHTKIKRNSELWCNIDRFILDDGINRSFNKKIKDTLIFDHSVTLEGQIVAIADEIAQRQHDLDDGMRDKTSGLKYDEVTKEVKNYINIILKSDINNIDNDFIDLMKDLNSRLDEKIEPDTMIRDIIEYFICDVTLSSFKKNGN
jgi:dGTPase